jgi:ABC-2 type transport system permease protein
MRWTFFVIGSEIRKILAFRADFWITFLGQTFVQILIARALWQSIFESSGQNVMEGFTLETMTLYYLIAPVGAKMLTGENIGFLSREIYDGSFNRYLIYPVSFFLYKTLTYLTYSLFYGLQLAVLIILYHSFLGGLNFPIVENLMVGLGVFVFASFTYANISILVELIALWADNIWSLMIMVRFLIFFLGGIFVPLNFLPLDLQKILQFTPFPYLIDLPIKTIMGKSSTDDISIGLLILLGWGVFFRLMAKLVWKKGQQHYTGIGI